MLIFNRKNQRSMRHCPEVLLQLPIHTSFPALKYTMAALDHGINLEEIVNRCVEIVCHGLQLHLQLQYVIKLNEIINFNLKTLYNCLISELRGILPLLRLNLINISQRH